MLFFKESLAFSSYKKRVFYLISSKISIKISSITDENLGVSAKVRKSLESLKSIKVKPPKSGHAYPALSDIESSGAERNTPEVYTPEPTSSTYTDDDNEQPIMDRYMYSSQDEGEEDR